MNENDDHYIGRDDPDEGRRLTAQRAGGLDELRRGLALCKLPEHPRVLDVGCGSGVFTMALHEALPDARIVGCDLNERLLAQAWARLAAAGVAAARVRFERADAARLPYAARAFDLVACRCLLMHQSDPAIVAGEIHRVVAADGYALAIEPDWGARATYPDAEALDALLDLARRGHPYGFPDLQMGRKLYALFGAMGFSPIWMLPTAFVATAGDLLVSQSASSSEDAHQPEGSAQVAPDVGAGPERLLIQGKRLLRAAGVATDADIDAVVARLVAARHSADYCVAGLDLLAVGHKPVERLTG